MAIFFIWKLAFWDSIAICLSLCVSVSLSLCLSVSLSLCLSFSHLTIVSLNNSIRMLSTRQLMYTNSVSCCSHYCCWLHTNTRITPHKIYFSSITSSHLSSNPEKSVAFISPKPPKWFCICTCQSMLIVVVVYFYLIDIDIYFGVSVCVCSNDKIVCNLCELGTFEYFCCSSIVEVLR